MAIQNNQITKDLIPMFKNSDFDDMKNIVERYAELSKIAKNIDDNTMSQTQSCHHYTAKRLGEKNTDDYMLAWTIYSKNAELLNKDLTTKLAESYTFELVEKAK